MPGWLGPHTAEEWVAGAHGEDEIACHMSIKEDGEWDGAKQCRGAAMYRANVAKRPRNPDVAVGPVDRELVFSRPDEFTTHHASLADFLEATR